MRKNEETGKGELLLFPSMPFNYFITGRYSFLLKLNKFSKSIYKENNVFSIFSQ